MKQYSNTPRKPMMGGGMAMSRLKRQQGTPAGQNGERTMSDADVRANADTQSRLATGRATPEDKAKSQQQRRETLRREIKQAKEDGNTAALNRFMKASSSPKGDGPIIKGILQDMGLAERAPAPQETSGMMYGGKAK